MRIRRITASHMMQEHQLATLKSLASRVGISRSELLSRILDGILPVLDGMNLDNPAQVSVAVFAMRPAERVGR